MYCPYCLKELSSNVSRDHVLPRVRGGRFGKDRTHSNRRLVHAHCNQLRQLAGECVGALACAFAVAETVLGNKRTLYKRTRAVLTAWRLMEGALVRSKHVTAVEKMRTAYHETIMKE